MRKMYENWKEGMKLEWEFYKRNPEFPCIVIGLISIIIWSIFHTA